MKNKKILLIWGFLFLFSVITAAKCMTNMVQICENRIVPTITVNSRGNTVKAIQERLKELGFYSGTADGVFGQGTLSAVKSFQASRGLKADGIVGSSTLEALGISAEGEPIIGGNSYEKDVRILAAAINGEGRGEPYEGQVAIGAVILNRVESDKFPNTVAEVVYQPGAFDAVRDGQINLTPNDSAYKAAVDALNGSDPTEGSLYYWNPVTATSKWIWSVPIKTQIGRHVFGTK